MFETPIGVRTPQWAPRLRPPGLAATLRWMFAAALALSIGCSTTPNVIYESVEDDILLRHSKFKIQPTTDGWAIDRLKGEEIDAAEIVLVHSQSQVFVIVLGHPGAAESLDDAVLSRRGWLEGIYEVRSFSETRRFRSGLDFVPISMSHYRVAGGPADSDEWIIAGALRFPAHVFEFICFGASENPCERLTIDLMDGLQPFEVRSES